MRIHELKVFAKLLEQIDAISIPPESWYLTGPTASGKTSLGIALARHLNAEIVSMDSMAIYRLMDVGTAKPTPEERAEVPHHLIDILDPSDEYSVSDYVQAARAVATEIRSRGKQVLFVGGTPLYLKGLLRGIFEGPDADPVLRAELERFADSGGDLHGRLNAIDPTTATKLHPNDRRRIIRAIEVYESTGKPISFYQTQFETPAPERKQRVFVLDWDKEELNRRIDRRVERMFESGLLEEARYLYGRPLGKTARQAVGYKELFEYFSGRGHPSLDETIALIQTHTRQFAKRQRTWFRAMAECRFVKCSP